MQKRILVVDDEIVIVDSLAEILKPAGYEVASAYSGEEALKIKRLCPSCRPLLFLGQTTTAELAQGFADRFSRLGYHFELLPKPIHPVTRLQSIENSLVRTA